MITQMDDGKTRRDEPVALFGLSTDPKPTDCHNASFFFEMDTGHVCLFDAEGVRWLKLGVEETP